MKNSVHDNGGFIGRVADYAATNKYGVYYDLNNATYDNVSSSAITEDAALQDLSFSSDGTKMYICGRNNDTVYQYTLSTAWNVSTALYANKSYYIGGQEGSLSDIFFKADGSKFYIIGFASDQVHQYSLSTAWDISTASYDNLEFSVSSQENNPRGLTFKPDGTKMFIIGQTADAIQEYALSTAWNVSSASHTSTFSTSSQLTNNQALFFAPDGYKVWATGADDVIYQYILNTAWDISTASYDSVSFSVLSQSTQTLGIEFSTDGTKLYALDNTLNIVHQYSTGYGGNKKNTGVWSMDADYLNAELSATALDIDAVYGTTYLREFTSFPSTTFASGSGGSGTIDVTFIFDMTFSTTDTGCILDQGGSTDGLYVGTTSGGNLRLSVSGAVSGVSNETSTTTTDMSAYAGVAGQLIVTIDYQNHIQCWWNDSTNGINQIVSVDFNGNGDWAGTDSARVGSASLSNTAYVHGGQDVSAFTGTITRYREITAYVDTSTF